MRCHRYAALDCKTAELCEIMGCQAGVPQTPAPTPPAPEPSLSWLERKAVALHDRLDGLTRKPAPEPPLDPLPTLTMEQILSEIRAVMPPLPDAPLPPPAPAPAPPPPPAPVATKQPPREIKVIAVPAGGWVFVEQNAPVAVAVDRASAGQMLAQLLLLAG